MDSGTRDDEQAVFEQSGPWMISSEGFKVRALGRSGMEYVSDSVTLDVDAEAPATQGFVLYLAGIPEEHREQIVDDVTRAWRWAGFDVQTLGP
jgi:hypothetical protein